MVIVSMHLHTPHGKHLMVFRMASGVEASRLYSAVWARHPDARVLISTHWDVPLLIEAEVMARVDRALEVEHA